MNFSRHFLTRRFPLVSILAVASVAAAAGAEEPPAAGLPVPARETRAQQVELLPDGSVEESLARRIDVGFGSVRIDGEKSNVPLSSLTADQVLAAETTKVPTPDLDADAVGGLLQLTSRRTFDQKGTTLRASTGAGYDALTGTLNPEGSVTFGRALGREARFGFVMTGSGRREVGRGEQVDADWDSSLPGGALEEVSVSGEDSRETTFGFNGLFDWKLGERSALQLRGSFDRETARETERSLAYRLDNRRQPATSTSEIERSLGEQEERTTAFTAAAGFAHKTDRWELDARISHTSELGESPDERSYEFRQDRVGLDYSAGDPRFPVITARAGARPDDPELFLLDEFQHRRGEQQEDDSVASLDLKLPELGGWKTAWVKLGTKFRALSTNRFEANDVFGAAGSGIRLTEVLGAGRGERIVGGRYALEAFPSAAALRELFAKRPERFALNVNATRGDTDPANYEVEQRVFAHYAMGSVALGRKTRFLGGVRMEHTANRFTGYEVIFDASGRYEATDRVGATGNYTNWFPGVHVTHAFAPNLKAFASWTQSIRRPDYDQLVPARRVDRSSGEIEEGNPNLRPTLYTNIDVALEFDYHRSGRVALEGFHREITDTRLERRTRLVGGAFDGYERRRPENGGGASLRGFEVKWSQQLSVLFGRLEGLGIEANYTLTESVQDVANRPGESLPLAELPERELTVQLAYERGGFFGSVEMNHRSVQLDSLSGERADDRFNPSQTRWDLALSYQFNRRWRAFLDVENLTEVPERSYEGEPSRIEDYGLESRQFRFGVKWEL